jgi:hypothetical protein
MWDARYSVDGRPRNEMFARIRSSTIDLTFFQLTEAANATMGVRFCD